MKPKFDVKNHILVPKHTKVSEKEKKELLEQYNITVTELPSINKKDPALRNLDVKPGDIIKIVRASQTAGESIFYRGVSND